MPWRRYTHRVTERSTLVDPGFPEHDRRVRASDRTRDATQIQRHDRAYLAQGWQCYTSIVEDRPCDRSDPLWDRWAARLGGERAAATPTQAQLASAGFIARIG